MARVVLDRVTKIFKGPKREKIFALREASLAVESKELLVLVGPSGSGKTTTLRLIAGLEHPTQGSISIDGQVVNDLPAGERDVAMVFQNYALYPHLTALENLAFGLRLRKVEPAETAARVAEVAELLGLTPCLRRRPKDLSGGECQRVALGRALVRRPRVLLLDEPLSNLDAPLRLELRGELLRLQERLGATFIYVTHDVLEAMSLGDRIAVVQDGAFQQVGEPMQLYHHPANLAVARFLGMPPMNLFPGRIVPFDKSLAFEVESPSEVPRSEHLSFALPGECADLLTLHVDKPVVLGLRPEHIAQARSLADMDAGNSLSARIEAVEPLGAETFLYLSAGGQKFVVRVPEADKANVGQSLPLVLQLEKARFFDPSTGKAIR